MKLSAIVLAAGESRRMGTSKLLLKVGDRRVLEHIVYNLKPIRSIVVTGHNNDEIMSLAKSMGAKTIYNPDYRLGMTTSLQAGLRALDTDVDAVFMVLGDIFGFSHTLLNVMANVLDRESDALIVSPVYKGKRGHPILFRRELFAEFMRLNESETLKTVTDRHETRHRYVDGDIWCVTDLDTPEDYERVRSLWASTRV
jgi:molybdenum cofactor cytidylyltransferase